MNNYVKKENSASKTDNVIPFPNMSTASSSSTNLDSILTDVFTNPEMETHLKSIVEGAVMDAWLKTRFLDFSITDDPFDAIYMSELQSDHISQADTVRILKYSNVIDLSDTISFEDDWED